MIYLLKIVIFHRYFMNYQRDPKGIGMAQEIVGDSISRTELYAKIDDGTDIAGNLPPKATE